MNSKELTESITKSELKKQTPHEIYLNFYGACTRIRVKSLADIEQLRFFYGYCEVINKKPDITIALLVDEEKGFIASLLDSHAAKAIYIETDDKLIKWEDTSSPIPPFSLKPLLGKYLLIHSSFIVNKSGKGIMLPAVHYQGKTSLMIELVRCGNKFLTDDISVIDNNLIVKPFPKPIGIRYNTLDVIPEIKGTLDDVSSKQYVSNVTGHLWVVRMQDLFPKSIVQKSKIDVVLFIQNIEGKKPEFTELRKGDALIELSHHFVNSGLTLKESLRRSSLILNKAIPMKLEYGLQSHLKQTCKLIEEKFNEL